MSASKPITLGAKIAPAVGMLLMGESALASVDSSPPDFSAPDSATLALLDVAAAAGGAVVFVRNRRNKTGP